MKRPSFILTQRAQQDIDDIWEYIAADSVEAADRVLAAIKRTILRAVRNPNIGHVREDLADTRHRFLLTYSYLVVYRHQTKPLQVIRILHAARDVQSILGFPSES